MVGDPVPSEARRLVVNYTTELLSRMTGPMSLARRHALAWYSYAFAAEVFSACALAIFLPITLEQMAREVGYLAPELVIPCDQAGDDQKELVCKADILGGWVDTASFSMYVKSLAVAIQALCIISIGPLADSPFWRKRLLIIFAYTGCLSAILLLLFPSSPHTWTPIVAALLTIVGNAGYATSIVCANAFLPALAREDPDVMAASRATAAGEAGDYAGRATTDEGQSLLPHALVPAVTAISTADLAETSIAIEQSNGSAHLAEAADRHASLLSLTTSRMSSTGTALGFLSGVSVLALLTIPVSIGAGSTASLRLAIGLAGIWWAVFTVPSWIGLPAGGRFGSEEGRLGDTAVKGRSRVGWMATAWKRVGTMIHPREMRKLPSLFTFLLAWIFLSDGFHTTTYTAILYASSSLHLPPAKIILIGILVQLAAVFSSILAPRYQRALGYSNLRVLLLVVVLALLLPLYACIGLILPFGGLRTEGEMYVAATWFGVLYGPFNSYARAVYAELIPPGHESSFFSLFSLTDKSASFLGPFVVGIIADRTGNTRLGFVFLFVMLLLPVPVLLRVDMQRGREEGGGWAEERGDEFVRLREGCEDEDREA